MDKLLTEKIGNVVLNYQYYNGADSYSDGDIEDRILEIVRNKDQDILLHENNWALLYHLSPIRENLLEWYNFGENQSLLEIGAECGAVTGLFCRKCSKVVAIDLSKRRSLINAYRNQDAGNLQIVVGNFEDIQINEKFDYVTLIGVLEYSIQYLGGDSPFTDMLKKAKQYLKPGGKLIIAIENKYGVKYWAGAREDHTGNIADGLMGYPEEKRVRTFSKEGLETLLTEAGFISNYFYYPLPDYKLPTEIYSEKHLPASYPVTEHAPNFDRDRYSFFNEEKVMNELIRERKFEFFANSFLVICDNESENKKQSDRQVIYAKYNSMRSPNFRVTTELCEGEKDRFYCKCVENAESKGHIDNIAQNRILLKEYYNNINVITTIQNESELLFPVISGHTLDEFISTNHFEKEQFIAQLNEQINTVLSVRDEYKIPFTSTKEFEDLFGRHEIEGVPALNPANIDSILSNFIKNDTGVYCLDYEWVFQFPVPVDYIRFRALLYLFVNKVHSLLNGISLEEMLGWFDYSEDEQKIYWQMEDNFQCYVYGDNRKFNYLDHYKKNNIRISDLEQSIHDKDVHIAQLETRCFVAEQNYSIISNSFFWKITGPSRHLLDRVKKAAKQNESLYLFLKTVKKMMRFGPGKAGQIWKEYLGSRSQTKPILSCPSKDEITKQRNTKFERQVKFSIIVPLYNTPPDFLKDMIKSVQNQSYQDWELCLADGSDAEHEEVGTICKEFSINDSRIKYHKLEKNLGISGNSNACIGMAEGDYIALLDHDDLLHPSALYKVMKVICEKDADFIYTDETTFHEIPNDAFCPHYKPDFAPDNLRANNYICHFTTFKKTLLKISGGAFRSNYDGSQDFDLVLRLTERAETIVHIPEILYFWRAHKDKGSVAEAVSAKPYVIKAAKGAISDHLHRIGLKGEVLDNVVPSIYRVKYVINGEPFVSILIPNMDHKNDLYRCINSILNISSYHNYEIIIIENNSKEKATFEYYSELESKYKNIKVVTWNGPFNYSAINNFGFKYTQGEHIILLNNDTEIISEDWIQEMLMYSQRSDVGAVGAKLYYSDHTIQHAGIGIGLLTLAGHYHKHFDGNHPGYMGRLIYAQNVSAVTGACVMFPRHVYEDVHGLDENFAVAFNDVDLCMRIRRAGYLIVWTPYAELFHYESKSRGYDDTEEKKKRFNFEVKQFQEKWRKELEAGDPYYNPNLTLDREDFSVRC